MQDGETKVYWFPNSADSRYLEWQKPQPVDVVVCVGLKIQFHIFIKKIDPASYFYEVEDGF